MQAEYREIIRIPNAIHKLKNSKSKTENSKYKFKIPKEFCLGTGHVTFFYNKLLYLHKRFLSLKDEMSRRGFANNLDDNMFKNLPPELYNDCEEINNDLSIQRIIERAGEMKDIKYYSIPIALSDYKKLLC